MNPDYLFTIRVTGILIEDNSILLVKQKLSDKRNWSLPGGKLERGETISQGLIQELKEKPVSMSKSCVCCTYAMLLQVPTRFCTSHSC